MISALADSALWPERSTQAHLSERKPRSEEETTLAQAAQQALKTLNKRHDEMQKTAVKQQTMPTASVSAKQAAAEHAEILKKRLEMLKKMMLGATPAQMKALAVQLKEIAKELSSLGRVLTGNGNTSAASSANSLPQDTTRISAESTLSENNLSQSAPSDNSSSSSIMPPPNPTSSDKTISKNQELNGNESSPTGKTDLSNNSNESLKKSLKEARDALLSAIAMLKNKLGKGNKDLRDAETQMNELDRIMDYATIQNGNAENIVGGLISGEIDIKA